MDSLLIAVIVFVCSLLGLVAGFLVGRRLPETHLRDESKDVVKQGFGVIATMVALVLGLLVASAKSAFDAENDGFKQLSTNIIMMDRALAQYGPEAKPAREQLRLAVTSIIDRLWPSKDSQIAVLVDDRSITANAGAVHAEIHRLSPKDDSQKALQAQVLQIGVDVAKTRWNLSQPAGPLIPTPFLVVMVCWLTVLFASYGLLTPPNATVVVTLLICALSLAGAVFLIVDLGEPLGGLIRASGDPLRYALSQLGQ